MSETKTFLVKYHLGEGIVAEKLVNALDAEEVDTNFGQVGNKSFKGKNDIFYRFKLSDVKMISVHEQKKAVVASFR